MFRLTCRQNLGTMSTSQSMPSGLSFIFSIISVTPNPDNHEGREGRYFEPPTTRNGSLYSHPNLYRWRNGEVTPAGNDVTLQPANLQQYLFSVATVFTQMPDTPHLLAVNLDAQTVNVQDIITWRALSFDHVPCGNTSRKYSFVSTLGSQQHLAAPGAPHWVPQLLPQIYNYRQQINHANQVIPSHVTSAGLIGSLPLLLALAVFSGPESRLDRILTRSLGRGTWIGHSDMRDSELPTFSTVAQVQKLIANS